MEISHLKTRNGPHFNACFLPLRKYTRQDMIAMSLHWKAWTYVRHNNYTAKYRPNVTQCTAASFRIHSLDAFITAKDTGEEWKLSGHLNENRTISSTESFWDTTVGCWTGSSTTTSFHETDSGCNVWWYNESSINKRGLLPPRLKEVTQN
jgi:hypothetical protein